MQKNVVQKFLRLTAPSSDQFMHDANFTFSYFYRFLENKSYRKELLSALIKLGHCLQQDLTSVSISFCQKNRLFQN